MRYAVVTFGCRVNQADSLDIEERLCAAGAVPAPAETAEVIVVNTCSVTATADQGARQTVRRVARQNPGARIVVTGYTLERYRALVDDIRDKLPAAAIGSDLIVGFPGETDRDVDLLVAYLSGSPLTHLHVFPYSDRPGTVAARLSPKVAGGVVRERGRRVRQVGAALAGRFRRSQVGTVRRSLAIENGSVAVTDNYLRVGIPPGARRNDWVDVRITAVGDPMVGTVVG